MILDGFVFPGKDTENMKIFRNKEIQMDMDKSLEIEKLELVIVEKIQEIKELEMVVNEKIDDIRKLQMVVDEKNIENEKLKTESIRNLSQISSITETTEEFKEELKQCKIKNKQISEELKKIQDDCSNKSEKIKDLEKDKKASDKIEKKNNKRKRGDETAVISIEAKRSRKCIEEEANDTIKQLKTKMAEEMDKSESLEKTINGEIENGNDTIEEINDDNNIEVN